MWQKSSQVWLPGTDESSVVGIGRFARDLATALAQT
jgi:hypothetical protein